MKNCNKTHNESGFTLIEVLIATIVLAIGLLSIAQAFAQGMLILVNTPVQLAAKELAFEIIDDFVVLGEAGKPVEPISQNITTRDGRTFLASASPVIDPSSGDLVVDVVVTYCTSCGGAPPTDPNASNSRNYRVQATITAGTTSPPWTVP